MRNLRQRGTAFAMALVLGVGMVMSGTPAYATDGESAGQRCPLLERALAAAIEKLGADSRLAVFLQGRYDRRECR